MSVIGQPVRPAARDTLLPGSKKSISSDEYTKYIGQVSLSNSSTHGNGHLLQLLDSQSRQRAVSGSGEEAAQHGTDVATSEFGSFSNKLGASVIALTSVKTAIDTDASGTQAADSAIATDSSGLEIAKSAMKDNLTQLATDPKAFHEAIKMSFGESYDQTKAEAIRVQVLEDDFSWMPDIKVVDKSVLTEQTGSQGEGQGLGAYSADTDTIYISAQLVQSDPDKTLQILTEEVGHGLDARLNTTDAAGDEGDIFARLVGGEEISDSELSALKQENDSGTIIVDGKEVEVEFGWFKKLKRKVKKAFKKVAKVVTAPLRAVKKVASKAWSGVKKGFKKVMQSKLLGTVMTLAQFIPIPMVQMAVRVYNVAKAAYATYQGVKHGSISMVLSGAAGVVGGVGKLGGMMGASSKFVERAAGISSKISTASAIHKTISEKNFAAAAGLASNYFGGSDTKLGNAFDTAKNAAETVENVENTVKAVKQTVAAVQAGDVNGALMGASSVYTIGNGALESGKATQSGLVKMQQFSNKPLPVAAATTPTNKATNSPEREEKPAPTAAPVGVGSHDAAQASAQQNATDDSAQQTTTDSPSTVGSLDAAEQSTHAPVATDDGTRESRTSEASIAGTTTQGALETYASATDAKGRKAAHDILTNGNAGNFNAPNGVKQADVAADFVRSNNTAEKALDATPFSSAARSTQQLADTADTVGRIGKVAGPIGTLAGPLVGAYEASTESIPDATIGDRFANVIGGGLKEFDDAAISGLSGAGVTALQFAASPVTGPAAPAVAITAPASGAAAAVAVSELYDDNRWDNAFDSAIDNYVEPVIASTVDGIVSGAEATSNAVSSASRTVKSWF